MEVQNSYDLTDDYTGHRMSARWNRGKSSHHMINATVYMRGEKGAIWKNSRMTEDDMTR